MSIPPKMVQCLNFKKKTNRNRFIFYMFIAYFNFFLYPNVSYRSDDCRINVIQYYIYIYRYIVI